MQEYKENDVDGIDAKNNEDDFQRQRKTGTIYDTSRSYISIIEKSSGNDTSVPDTDNEDLKKVKKKKRVVFKNSIEEDV